MKLLRVIPMTVMLAIVWAAMRLSKMDLSLNTPNGIGIVIACFVILTLEFFKSGDISLRSYMIDQAFAILSLIGVSVLITLLFFRGEALVIADWLVAAVCLIDSWLCPVNSFRTALRNWQSAVAPAAHIE